MAVHDASAVTVAGQVAVLLDELLDELADELLDVEGTLDSELLDIELEDVLRSVVELLLVVLLGIADVVGALEVELVTVFTLAFDVVLDDTLDVGTLDVVCGVVTETVMKA